MPGEGVRPVFVRPACVNGVAAYLSERSLLCTHYTTMAAEMFELREQVPISSKLGYISYGTSIYREERSRMV